MFKKVISLILALLLVLSTVPAVFADSTLSKKMLYINSTGPKELIQRVEVTAGETYYFTFGLSNTITNFNAVCYTDGGRSFYDADITQISAESLGGSTLYTYSYTISSDFAESLLFFGVKAVGSTEGYLFDASVYNADDENKTELMPNPDFSDALNEWAWGWDAWFGYWNDATLTEWSNDTATLRIVDYDEELLGIGFETEDTVKEKMLYIKSSAPKELIQRAEVEAGNTYYFTFGLSNTITDFAAVCYKNGLRSNYDANIQQISKDILGAITLYTYSYTIPSDFNDDLLFFGIKASGNTEGYFFNASVYNVADETKTELFTNSDFSSGALDEWAWGWDIWFAYDANTSGLSEWSNEKATLEIVDFDENLKKTMLHIRYESIDMTDDVLVQKLENVEADTEYTISFNYHFLSGDFNEAVKFALIGDDDGSASTIRKTLIDFSADSESIVSTANNGVNVQYVFSLDSTITDSYEGLYAGFYFKQSPRMITEFYVSDFVVYKTSDTNKTNILEKKSFYDMYGWYSHWITAAEGSLEFGSSNAEYLEYLAKYVAYNEELLTPEKDDIHYGDTNFDGVIDARDLVKLKKHIAVLGGYISSFDCNCDNSVSAADLTAFRRHLIGDAVIKWEITKSSLQRTENLMGGADSQAEKSKNEIVSAEDTLLNSAKSTVYYISENGSYSNSGLNENNAITFEKLRATTLKSGDTVLFKRGDTFRIGSNYGLVTGVNYGAYGSGEKPVISGSLRDYADSNIWSTDDGYLWKTSLDSSRAANIVFNGGEYVGVPQLSLEETNDDGKFYFDSENKILYLYLRQYNPGHYFNSIEISSVESAFLTSNIRDVVIENISIRYFGIHAINLLICENIKITGCEVSWIGGAFTGDGTGGRYGNAIQFWDKAVNCEVSNNYIYQIYDAALTFQGNDGSSYTGLTYTKNLVEYTSMNFEFWDEPSTVISDIDFSENILRFGGYGFGGLQRDTKLNQAYILGWYSEYNDGNISNFNITDNIFDIANCRFIYAYYIDNLLNISGNTYFQDANSDYFVTVNAKIYADSLENFSAAIKAIDSEAVIYWETEY